MLRSSTALRMLAAAGFASGALACSGILGLTDPVRDDDYANDDGGDDTDDDGGPSVDDDGAPSSCDGADLTQDESNCGACGHSCLGGTCADSTCQPVLVVSDANALAPYQMILNGGVLYMSNVFEENGISNVAKISADAIENDDPYSIVAQIVQPDGGNVYGAYPYQFAVSGPTLFVSLTAHAFAGDQSYFGGLFKCPTDGCGTVDPTTLDLKGVNVGALANGGSVIVHDAYTHSGNPLIYTRQSSTLAQTGNSLAVGAGTATINWITIDQGIAYVATTDSIARFTVGETVPPIVMTNQRGEELTTNASNVYFTSGFGKTPAVFSIGKTSSTATLVSTGMGLVTPAGVAVDDTYVYFADEGQVDDPSTGALYRCPLSGCDVNGSAAVKLSTGDAAASNPRSVLVTANAVYWGTRTGSIWKLAK